MSEDLVSVIRSLTARAAAEPLPLIALTDEEIAALGAGPADLGPVPLPWLAAMDEASRELACQVALRGLAARRLIVPLGPEDRPDGDREYAALHDDLRAVLAMRRSARAVICALRESDERLRLVYLGATGALEEAISPGGLHGFTVLAHAAVPGRLAGFADPHEAAAAELAPGPGSVPRIVPLAEIARGAQLPVTGVRSVTMVSQLAFGAGEEGEAGGEQRLTVYAKEAGVTIASPVDSGPGPGGEPVPALRFAEVTRTGLRECLAALLPASADLVSEEVS
jgi:hypothetical protein